MSMNSFHIYGYGFASDCDEEKLIDFIKAHKDTFCRSDKEKEMYKEMFDHTSGEYDLEDFFSSYSDDQNGNEGSGAVISNIMSRETGLRFEYCKPDSDCGTSASVVFPWGYPWQYNEAEKNLTQEKLDEICKVYIDELGILEDPEELELEYWG